MKLDNLYFVESPLQALCALEVSLSLPDETHGIIVRLANTELRRRNDQQIQEVMGLRKWDYYHRINSHNRGHALFNYLYYRSQLIKLKKRFSGRVNRLYIGEFRTGLMHQVRGVVKAKQDYLLDDGAATIRVVNDYLTQGVYFNPALQKRNASKFKGFLYDIIYFKVYSMEFINRPLKVKSVYEFVNYDNSERIDFSHVKSLYENSEYIDKVYYFGSKYSEAAVLTLDDEIDFIKKVKDFFYNKSIVYFAHRDESEEKLKIIRDELLLDIKIPETLAELNLLKSKERPKIIASAYSSVLPNIASIFPEIKLMSFKLDLNLILRPGIVDGIEMTYTYFEKIGIPVVDLYKAQGD